MKDIKFRAWDLLTKQYYSWEMLFKLNLTLLNIFKNDGLLLEQYTGLKDKFRNDKEVYEGDIYKWIGVTFAITIDSYHGNRFMFGKDILCKAYIEEGHFLGNIHENKNLLEKTNERY